MGSERFTSFLLLTILLISTTNAQTNDFTYTTSQTEFVYEVKVNFNHRYYRNLKEGDVFEYKLDKSLLGRTLDELDDITITEYVNGEKVDENYRIPLDFYGIIVLPVTVVMIHRGTACACREHGPVADRVERQL